MSITSIFRFNRILSLKLAQALAPTAVSPNAVTAAGLFCGLAAAVFFSAGDRAAMISAALFLHAAFIFDSCDGDLARMTGKQSEFGRWFDVFSDVIVDLALWWGLWAAASAYETTAHVYLAAACAGSLLNFALILRERQRGCSFHVADETDEKRRRNPFFVFLESLAHNGITIVPAYALAFFGDAAVFLASAAVFVNALWIARVLVNRRQLALDTLFGWAGKTALWALGGYLPWCTLRQVSWPAAGELLQRAGTGILIVLAVYPLACVFHALGFYVLFSRSARKRIGFGKIFAAYLQGDALNKVTPLVDVGGEPAKIVALQKAGRPVLSESIQAVYLSRVTLVLSEFVLMAAGTALAAVFWPSPWILAAGLAACGVSGAFLLFLLFSRAGLSGLLSRAVLGAEGRDGLQGRLGSRIRRGIDRVFSAGKKELFVSYLWNQAAWIVALLEIYIALQILQVDIALFDAFLLHAVLRCVQTATFFVPVNLGTQEGGLAYLALHLGFTGAHGLAISLTKRMRQCVYGCLAALCFFLLVRKIAGSTITETV